MQDKSSREVVIVGGGIAGISAAFWALEYGIQPIILERAKQLGGRISSFYANDVQDKIDIGQHVLSSSYDETLYLLSKIKTKNKIHLQKRLFINFKINSNKSILLKTWPIFAPAHIFLPLLINSKLSWQDRKCLLKWTKLKKKTSYDNLKKITVEEWLENIGQSSNLIKLFWAPLTIAALNTPINKASALLLFRVLEKSFFYSISTNELFH